MEKIKRCPRCKVVKERSEFNLSEFGLAESYCKECNREYHKIRYQNNPGYYFEKSLEWRLSNPEKDKLYRAADKANLRASKVGALGTVTWEQLKKLVESYSGKCVYCGAEYKEFDHVIPFSSGGSNDISNIVPACRSCNKRKGAKSLREFFDV